MLRWGFELAGLEENRVAFSRNKGPDPALGCILLFLFVIPGIIYLILAEGETVYTTVSVEPTDDGRTRVTFSSNERGDEQVVRQFLSTLPSQSR